MYTLEQRKRAVELYIQYGHNGQAVCKQLGYPSSSHQVREWYEDGFFEIDKFKEERRISRYYISEKDKARAVEYYLTNKRNLSKTVRDLGVPRRALEKWIDDLAPGQRRCTKDSLQFQKVEQLRNPDEELEGGPMEEENDTLNQAYEELHEIERETAEKLKELALVQEKLADAQMKLDLAVESHELLKKSPGVDLKNLTNKEKAQLVDAIKEKYLLNDILDCLDLARSSYFYQRKVLATADKYDDLRILIKEIFLELKKRFGYRTVWATLKRKGIRVSEKVVRRIMCEENLVTVMKRRKGYSSYTGESNPAADNILNRDFSADAPNKKWLTDLTEFKLSSGKVYLSPIIDCFDGQVVSWTMGTSPNAALVNDMLDRAVATLGEAEHPLVHSDRGCHYRWPGWIERMEGAGLIRSMSKKGCSPDNSACEGFFGRLKNEFFYYRSWRGVSIKDFMRMLDEYIHWYNEKRIKRSLGWMSPAEYRRSLGLAR